MIPTEKRFVLLDTEEKTARLLGVYHDLCGGLDWSPDAEYLKVSGAEFDYLKVSTGKTFSLKKEGIAQNDSVYYQALTWTSSGDSLLAEGTRHEDNRDKIYLYSAVNETWSSSIREFADTANVVGFMPHQNREEGDFLIMNWAHNSYADELWRFRRPENTYEQLTNNRMPKVDATSYHYGH